MKFLYNFPDTRKSTTFLSVDNTKVSFLDEGKGKVVFGPKFFSCMLHVSKLIEHVSYCISGNFARV